MLVTIKGIYENGLIKPLENVDIKGKAKVIITFLDIKEKNLAFFLLPVLGRI